NPSDSGRHEKSRRPGLGRSALWRSRVVTGAAAKNLATRAHLSPCLGLTVSLGGRPHRGHGAAGGWCGVFTSAIAGPVTAAGATLASALASVGTGIVEIGGAGVSRGQGRGR